MAVIIDATLVRALVLPALLSLLGDQAWKLRAHGPVRVQRSPS